MKKTLLLKTMLLLCALVAGSLNGWAETTYKLTQVTSVEDGGLYVFEQDGYVMNNTISSKALQSTNSFKTTGLTGAESYIWELNKSGSNYYMKNVKETEFLHNASSTDLSFQTTKGNATAWNFSFQTDNTVLITNPTLNRFLGYTNSTSHAYKAYATSNLSSYPHAIKVFKLEEEASYEITALSNNSSWGTVSLTGNVITATPANGYTYADPAYTVTTGTATVEQNGNEFTVTASADCTVRINFEAIPVYTVTFSDGGSLTEEYGGAGVTLPSRASVGEYTFAGWSETNIATETTVEPTIIPAGEYHPTANVTFYPVYTKTESGSGIQNKTASVTISDYATANSWESGTKYTTVTMDENVSVTGSDNGDNSKYYSNGNDWRFYASTNPKGKITILTTSGELSSIKLTYSGTFQYNNSNVTSGTSLNVSGSSVELTCTSNARITAISVNYTISGSSTTYYWSSPVAAAVERPIIEIANNPFTFSTTASITCTTVGATIYYSYDNSTWSEYTTPLTITETKTIYAKAILGDDESTVASATATKNLVATTVTIDDSGITNKNKFTSTEAGTLAATVMDGDSAVDGVAVTWSGNNDEVATVNATSGAVTIFGAGSVTFTATFAGNSDYSESSATKTITFTDYNPNGPGTENNPYTVADVIDGTASGNDKYVVGYIVGSYGSGNKSNFTRDGVIESNLAIADDPDETDVDNTVAVQLPTGTIRNNFNLMTHKNYLGVVKVLVKADITSYITTKGLRNTEEIIAISEDVKVTTAKYATYCSTNALNFGATDVKAYKAKVENGKVKLTEIENGVVPANTGVMLYCETADTYAIPVTTTEATVSDNEMVGTTELTPVPWESNGKYNYILQKDDNGNAKFFKATGANLIANRAYLSTTYDVSATTPGARSLDFVFDDGETTGIADNNRETITNNGSFFDLQGRKVANPTKGLYIVNGKKMVVK